MKVGIPAEEGQVQLMFNKGGPRRGAGRKGIGETRKVSLTLSLEMWERFEQACVSEGRSKSELLRMMVEHYMDDVSDRPHKDVTRDEN